MMSTVFHVAASLVMVLWSPMLVLSALSAYTEYLWQREPERVLSAGVVFLMLCSVTLYDWNAHIRMGFITQLSVIYSYLVQWFRASRLVEARNATEKGVEALRDACASIHRDG